MPIEWPKGKRPVFIGAGSTMCRRYYGGSKSARANEAALNAVKIAAPFPGLPEGIGRDFLELELPFKFEIKMVEQFPPDH